MANKIKGQMRVLGSEQQLRSIAGDLPIKVQGGHTTVTWETKEEQETAQEFLQRLLSSRYVVFAKTETKDGEKATNGSSSSERTLVRDAKVGPEDDLMVIPPMAGGC